MSPAWRPSPESSSLLSPAPQIWPMLVSVVPCCQLLTTTIRATTCGHNAQSWKMHSTESYSMSWPCHRTCLGSPQGWGLSFAPPASVGMLPPPSEEGFARWMHYSSLCQSSLTYRMYRINSLLSLTWVYTPTVCTDIEYIRAEGGLWPSPGSAMQKFSA